MGELVILVVEDEPEVRAEIVRDLETFTQRIRVDEAESVDDAEAAIAEAVENGDGIGLAVVDHRLPGRSGVDLLAALHGDPATRSIRTILITGQAGHQDTIRAINKAGLDHYIAKPWDPDELVTVAKRLLTDHVIESDLDPLAYVPELDAARLLDHYGEGGSIE